MKATIQEVTEKGNITFLNVPVTGCKNCEDEGFSMRNGLIIEHYAKHHSDDEMVIDFEEIHTSYEGMDILQLIQLSRSTLQ